MSSEAGLFIYFIFSLISVYYSWQCNQNDHFSFQAIMSLLIAFFFPPLYISFKIQNYAYTGYSCFDDYTRSLSKNV
jgi:hypothetical protein